MSKLLKNSLIVSVLSLGSALVNFLSQIVIASFFGANAERDAFFAASIIPTYINTIIAGSLGVIFLPKLIDTKINKAKEATELISGIMSFTLLLLTSIALGMALFSSELIGLLFPGFGPDDNGLASQLLLLLCPAIIFQSLTSMLTAIYHSEKRFLIPSSSFLITPTITILMAFLLHETFGIATLAIGTSAGWALTFLILQINLPEKYEIRPSLMLRSKPVRDCLRDSLPWLFGGFIYRGSTVVERMIASRFPEGVISYLGYAGGLITTLSSITMNGIGTTIFPLLAESWSGKDRERLRQLFGLSVKFTFVLCVPIIVTILAFGDTIVMTLFERGAFSHQDTEQVSGLLTIMTASFLFICLNTVPGKLLYVTGTSKLAIVNGFFEVAIYILASLVLTNFFSYTGIAYAQILSTMCSTIFVTLILHLKFQILKAGSLFLDLLKIVLCGVVSYFCMITFSLWFNESFPILLLFGSIGLLLYFYLVTRVLKEAGIIRSMILGKIQKFFVF